MRNADYYYEVEIDDKVFYFYSKTDINNSDNKTIVLWEYFTDTKAFYRVIGTQWHHEITEKKKKINYYTNIYGLFFPETKLIYASRSITYDHIKNNFDKNQPSVTRQFKIKSMDIDEFYSAIKIKSNFAGANKHLFHLFLKKQVLNKNKDIKKDILEEKHNKLHILKMEQKIAKLKNTN